MNIILGIDINVDETAICETIYESNYIDTVFVCTTADDLADTLENEPIHMVVIVVVEQEDGGAYLFEELLSADYINKNSLVVVTDLPFLRKTHMRFATLPLDFRKQDFDDLAWYYSTEVDEE